MAKSAMARPATSVGLCLEFLMMQTFLLARSPTENAAGSPGQAEIGKRYFNLALALLILAALSPVLVVLAVGVRLSGRQIIFAHERVGKDGVSFRCFKFRSMQVDAEARLEELLANSSEARAEWARDFKLKHDPRVTRLGSFLRKTSLDELPQLLNVVAGDMHLVGPRPIVAEELSRYGRHARHYLSAKPGMTGLWQVSGRSDTSYRRRVVMDRAYVARQCMSLDLSILARTALVIFGRKSGAY